MIYKQSTYRQLWLMLTTFFALYASSAQATVVMRDCLSEGQEPIQIESTDSGLQGWIGYPGKVLIKHNATTTQYWLPKNKMASKYILLNDGQLLAAGEECDKPQLKELLYLYDANGKMLWKKGMEELGLKIAKDSSSSNSRNSYYEDYVDFSKTQISSDGKAQFIVLTLRSENQIEVTLDGQVTYSPVSIEELGDNPDSLFNRGRHLLLNGQEEEGARLLLAVLKLKPDHCPALSDLSSYYRREKKYKDNIHILEKSISYYPIPKSNSEKMKSSRDSCSPLWLRADLGDAYSADHKPEAAKLLFNEILQYNKLDARAIKPLAKIYISEKNSGKARALLADYVDALEKGPAPYEDARDPAYLIMAQSYLYENNYSSAGKYFDKRLELADRKKFNDYFPHEIDQAHDEIIESIHRYRSHNCKTCSEKQLTDLTEIEKEYIAKKVKRSNKPTRSIEEMIRIAANYVFLDDMKNAFFWYKKAEEKGSLHDPNGSSLPGVNSYLALSYFYWDGQAVKQDFSKAFQYCKKAVGGGFDAGLFWTAIYYASGTGIPKDENKAIELLTRVSALGYPVVALPPPSNSFEYPGGGMATKYWSWATDVVRQLADKNYGVAQYLAGYMFFHGVGVAPDFNKAERYLSAAAAQGFGKASLYMGHLIDKYERNVSTSGTALAWYKKAADQGEAAGDYMVAKTLLNNDSCNIEEIEKILARHKINYIRTMKELYPKSTYDYSESVDKNTKEVGEKIRTLKVTCNA